MLNALYSTFLLTLELALAAQTGDCPAGPARNIILVVGDGMGQAQVDLASLYTYGQRGAMSFEQLPFRGMQRTASANNPITDSAAAATAMATGRKVNNGVVSLAVPGDERPLETVLQQFQRCGRSTGVVVTAVAYHATPAAFLAHVPSRNEYEVIVQQMLHQARPHVIFGGGGRGLDVASAAAAGYTALGTRDELLALDVQSAGERVAGVFHDGHLPYATEPQEGAPTLREMTTTALALLDRDPDGFFLLVEGSRIDHAGHDNLRDEMILETVALDQAVHAIIDWASDRTDTFVLVTSDHETGGVTIVEEGARGVFSTIEWETTWHTAQDVPWYAWGPSADVIPAVIDNTDVYRILRGDR